MRSEKDLSSLDDYIDLGYDPKIDSKIKHWRYNLKKELEKCPEIMPISPFSLFGLTRGLSPTLFQAHKRNVSEFLDVGTFKGWIRIQTAREANEQHQAPLLKEIEEKVKHLPESENKKVAPYINLYSMFKLDNMYQSMERELSKKTNCIVRLYVIEAFGLKSRDFASPPDPYLRIEMGKTVIDEREKHQDNTECPKFYSKYEFKVELPTVSVMKVQLYDYDYIGEDLIGETLINLDDRYYSPFWHALPEKPIEDRSLHSEESSTGCGTVRLWVDIFKAGTEGPIWNITPQPDAEFELRVVVWETKDVGTFDIEETTDAFVRGFLDPNKDQHTDTHFRCQEGNACFNWRLVFPVTLSAVQKNKVFTLQLWDKDILAPNDYIGSCTLNLSKLFSDAFLNNKSVVWDEKYHELAFGNNPDINIQFDDDEPEGKYKSKFWVPTKSKDRNNPDVSKDQGSILISVSLLTKEEAAASPVGKGREEPNHDPYLPPPVGRFKWSLNPFTMLNQLVGKGVRCKVYCLCCICCLLIIIAWVGPSLISALITS